MKIVLGLVERNNVKKNSNSPFRKFFESVPSTLKSLGPGLITGAADDDPSGIATYSQAGAKFGLGMLWMALYLLPLIMAIQEMCARIGLLSGNGLAALIKNKIFCQNCLSNIKSPYNCKYNKHWR